MNVPVEVNNMVNILPRVMSNVESIQILFLRQAKNSERPYINERVRPLVIYEAAKYLVEQPLYKKHNVTLSKCFCKDYSSEQVDFIADQEGMNKDLSTLKELKTKPIRVSKNKQTKKQRIERDQSVIDKGGVGDDEEDLEDLIHSETLVDTIDDEPRRIAPCENHKPISLLYDEDAEELSFPVIYCGQKRPALKGISYSKVIKSQLRMFDRRACSNSHIFFAFRKEQLLRISSSLAICLRKSSKNISVQDLINDKTINELKSKNEAYDFLRCERVSPVYWEKRKKEVMAMVRQIGCPTFFITLTSNQLEWMPLLKSLIKTQKTRDITEDEISKLTKSEKRDLISNDPVTCARYWDYRFHRLLNVFKKKGVIYSDNHVVVDDYYRIEIQFKGAPHAHGLQWLDDAPIYKKDDKESIQRCIEFIDQNISCSLNHPKLVEKNMCHLIEYQLHHHTESCKKYLNSERHLECRFFFPRPPLPETLILEPLNHANESFVDAH